MLFGMIVVIVFVAILVGMIVMIFRVWGKGQQGRQSQAEAQRARNGGQAVLEWSGPKAQGPADPEFGELLVEIPKKSGDVELRFYRLGFILKDKRTSYENLKDVVYIPGTPGLALTPKQKLRNAAVLWIYRKKGSAIGIRDLTYCFDDATMVDIQTGLGFRNT